MIVLVQKSFPILMMGNDPFSIGELKILDTYLARINSHDFKSRRVTFTKVEYEKLLGLSDVRIDQLKKYTDGVQSKIVEIKINKNGIWIARFHYLSQKYAILEHYASIKKIPNKFRYLKKIIEND